MAEEKTTRKLRPSEFPIYEEPTPPTIVVVTAKDSAYRQQVSSARKWVWDYLESIQDTVDAVKQKYEVAKQHTKNTLTYIQEDSGVIPRAVIITVSGLGGIVAGYRGGVMRKTIYAGIGMGAAGAVCYPKQAVELTNETWRTIKTFVVDTYQSNVTTDIKPTTEKKKVDEPAAKSEPEQPSPLEDHGMSKPEDKDMYTTRQS